MRVGVLRSRCDSLAVRWRCVGRPRGLASTSGSGMYLCNFGNPYLSSSNPVMALTDCDRCRRGLGGGAGLEFFKFGMMGNAAVARSRSVDEVKINKMVYISTYIILKTDFVDQNIGHVL